MVDTYILIGSFAIGVLSLLITLVEIRMIYSFIRTSQGKEDVPILDDKEKDQSKNRKIREFRRFLMSKKAKNKDYFVLIKKKVVILNASSFLGYTVFGLGIAYLYFTR